MPVAWIGLRTDRVAQMMRPRSPSIPALLFVSLAAAVGCNAIFDNHPATRVRSERTATETDPTSPDESASSDDDVPASTTEEGENRVTTPDPAVPTCPVGQKECRGLCVDENDPTYGCGSNSCTPCSGVHGTATCQDRQCVMQACDPGYADCNHVATDGCEADFAKPTSCGACGTACLADRPVCAPTGPSYSCATGCPINAPFRCGAECVSPLSSVNHCGACNAACLPVEHGDVSCAMGACTFKCKPKYHKCTDKCAADTDPTSCGPTCKPCPIPPNAVATCQKDACAFACLLGFGNCNTLAADGCESNLMTDPLNCGICGRSCNGGACVNGACKAADAGP